MGLAPERCRDTACVEILCRAGESKGTNRTGTYVVKVKLDKDIPELLPVAGRRIHISYPGVRKKCTNCLISCGITIDKTM